MPALVNTHRHRALATRRVDTLSVLLVAAQRAKTIGARMRERRDELQMTQTDVANAIGVSSVTKDYVSRWERGTVEPSEAYLNLAATALKTTVADLMAGPVAERGANRTPDVLAVVDAVEGLPQLDRIERKLDRLLTVLDPAATIPVAGLGDPPPAPMPHSATAQPSGRGRRRAG